jgi:zinc D-Ala-D-Ala dipeptidase
MHFRVYYLAMGTHDPKKQFALAMAAFARKKTSTDTLLSVTALHRLNAVEQLLTFVPDRVAAELPYEECGDPMIDLGTFLEENGSRIRLTSGTTAYGSRSTTMSLRKKAAERMLDAEKFLQTWGTSLTFRVTDAFRPLSLQRKYFEQFTEEIRKTKGLTGDALYDHVHRYIADPDIFPPHTTGGAVDSTVCDAESDQDLDMGTAIDAMDDERILAFHGGITDAQKENRSILFAAMTAAGFVGYPTEWWHFSYGEKEWAMRSKAATAIYLPVDS